MNANEADKYPDPDTPESQRSKQKIPDRGSERSGPDACQRRPHEPPPLRRSVAQAGMGGFCDIENRRRASRMHRNHHVRCSAPGDRRRACGQVCIVDPRFPPIGPAELPSLEVEISVLGPLKEVHDINEIKIGRDGLIIECYGRHGLLLPQVATEHGLDLRGFLCQTCLKAGLPQDTWRQGARIYRFSAEVFQ